MNVVALRAKAKPCPICGSEPHIDRCEPWPRDAGPVAWHAVCYRITPTEHCVGVNAETEAEVIRDWNAEVDKIARGDFESPPTDFEP